MKTKSSKSSASRSSRRAVGGGDSANSSTTHIVVLAGMAVILALIYYYIYMDNQYTQHIESFTDGKIDIGSNEVVLALFYADWCPHCVKFKPEWDRMTSALNETSTKKGKKVKMMKVNCEENKALASKYGIDGYPTIKVLMMDGGKESAEDYSGQRNMSAIKEYLESL